jgi:hypothetical protein
MRRYAFALGLAAILAACGGGDGDNRPQERWSGTLEDADLLLYAVSIIMVPSFAGERDIIEVRENGVATGLTGAVGPRFGLVYEYNVTDGVDVIFGNFLVDASETHMAFADEGLNFGVLQKDATSLPTYAYADLAGTWSGRSIETDFAANVIEVQSGAALATTITCQVTDPAGGYSANFDLTFDAAFGRWQGDYTAGPTTGSISAFLSPDKTFLGVWACADPDPLWPEDCVFSAWRR